MEDLKLVTVKFNEESKDNKQFFERRDEDLKLNEEFLDDIKTQVENKSEKTIPDVDNVESEFSHNIDEIDISKLKNSAEIFGLTPRELQDEFIGYKIEKLFKRLDYFIAESIGELSLRERIYAVKKNGFGSITVLPTAIPVAKKYIEDNNIEINALICYPFGEEFSRTKIGIARLLSRLPVSTLSIPVNPNMLTLDRLKTTLRELKKMGKITKNKQLRVIIEPTEFTQSSLVALVKLCIDANISTICIKISEGGISSLKALKALCGNRIALEAMGEISLKQSASLLALGVKKLSASNIEDLSAEIATKLKE